MCGDAIVPRVLVIPVPYAADFPQVSFKICRAQEIPDLGAQHRELARIERLSAVILLDQAREGCERTVILGVRQRRHEVVDDDSMRAALRLRPLTRIVHHERVEQRHVSEQRVGCAVR